MGAGSRRGAEAFIVYVGRGTGTGSHGNEDVAGAAGSAAAAEEPVDVAVDAAVRGAVVWGAAVWGFADAGAGVGVEERGSEPRTGSSSARSPVEDPAGVAAPSAGDTVRTMSGVTRGIICVARCEP